MDLARGQKYVITVTTNFIGEFVGYEEEPTGARYALFQETGRTDRGNIPMRRIKVENIVSAELTKVPD